MCVVLCQVIDKRSQELRALLLDFIDVKMVDITGLIGLKEVVEQSQLKGVLVGGVNISSSVNAMFVKFGITLNSLEVIRSSLETVTPSGKCHKEGHTESKNSTLLSPGTGGRSENETTRGNYSINISRNNSGTSVNGGSVIKRKVSCESKNSARSKNEDENGEYKDYQLFNI